MIVLLLIVDIILASSILLVSFLSLRSENIFDAIVLFICVGVLVAMTWARMGAIDIALAEASIGAGVTGAILIAAWFRLESAERDNKNKVTSNDQ